MDQTRVQESLGDRFRLDAEVGRGAMAVVYRAFDVRHDRWVAIKVLKPDLVDSASAERFLREIRIEGRLQHPHILPIYESGPAGRLLYYVMPFVEGESLRERIERDGALPVADAIRIAREIADALACAHARDLVHRDVKPGNILLSGGHAILADFGVARAVAESAGNSLTTSGMVIGTPIYMSPEQTSSSDPLDGRSDIYSLGCVLYEMLAGEPPYSGRTVAAIFAKHCAEPVPSLDIVRPGLPPQLTRTVTRMLAKVPADRPRDARLLDELDESMALATRGHVATTRVRRWTAPKWAAALMAAAIITTAAAWFALRPEPLPLDPQRVVVFPLAMRGADPDGGGIDLLIGLALDHIEPLRWFAGWNWLSPEQRANPGSLGSRDYRRISRTLGAGFFMTGQVLERPEEISVHLSLYGTNSDVPVDETSAIGALGVASANDVMLDALRNLLPSLVDPGREIDLGLIANREPAAIASWVQGQRSYRFSRFEEALAHYQRALDEDSLLTSAALKGAQAANWSHQPGRARELIDRATAHAADLTTRHRLYLGGLSAYLDGQADTALARLAAALEHDPHWSEAWMLMGEVHEHLLPSTVSTDSAISMFRRAAADPGFTPPLIHLAEHAIREGRTADSRDLIRRLDRNGASAAVIADLETMATCAERGPDAVEFPILARSTPDLVYDLSVRLSPGAMQAECAAAGFAALLTADAWSTLHSWAAARGLHGLRVTVGDIAGAERFSNGIVESATLSQNPNLRAASTGMLWLSVLTAIGGAPMPSLTDRFEAIAHDRYGEGYAEIRGVFTAWLLGNWHGYNNDAAPLVRLRDYLASVADTTGSTQARLYADALSARVDILVDRDTAAAIERLERLISWPAPRDSVLNSLAAPFAPERLLLAELHLARGDYRRAHAVAAAFDHGATAFLPFIPASLRIRRDAALARGDDALASRYTRRLRALGHADQDGDDTSTGPPATRRP